MAKPLKEHPKDLLHLHSSERRGMVLLVVLLGLITVWTIRMQWSTRSSEPDLEPIRTELQAWLDRRDSAAHREEAPAREAELFPFDPNTLARDGWLALGLTERQVDGIDRYRSKGGRFRTKKDLGRLYSLRPEQVERLLPYVQLPDSIARPQRATKGEPSYGNQPAFAQRSDPRQRLFERTAFHKVELNTADTVALVALPGIGPAFARGMVKYRESLGGYHSLDQLAEVYVLRDKPDAVAKLKELLVLDTLMVRRIPINTCTVEELAAHPYARWKLAKPLIAYRNQHGRFSKLEEIKGCALIDADAFRKLAPYLTVE